MELIGLWPRDDEIDKSKLASDLRVGIIFIIVAFVSGIPLVCSLIRVWGNMILMIDNLQFILLIVSLKLSVMRWKGQVSAVKIITKYITQKYQRFSFLIRISAKIQRKLLKYSTPDLYILK